MKLFWLCCGWMTCVFLCGQARTIYLSPSGSDRNTGTSDNPVLTITRARQLASDCFGKESVRFLFGDGTYYLSDTWRIGPECSGTESYPVVYEAQHPGKAVISGGERLDLKWQKMANGICVTSVPRTVRHMDQLYVNGMRRIMARYPNAVSGKNVFDCWDLNRAATPDSVRDVFNVLRVERWKNPEKAYIHAMHAALWGDMHWVVKGKDANGKLVYEGGWQNNRPAPMHPVFRIVENVFEELDTPGEWYYDEDQCLLYYIPLPGEDLDNACIEVVRLRHLLELIGTRNNPVSHIHIKGFVFKHTARTFMENKEPLLRSDWTVYRGGALVMEGTRNCTLIDCEFDQVGGNAVFVNRYNRGVLVKGCYIHDSGANGIAFVGDTSAVRSPLFRYGPQNYEKLDRTPGPRNDLYPADCRVEDCLLTRTGRVEKQTAPIQISMSKGITVTHCSIYDVPRAGINISEGTFGGHVISWCDVFNTVLETSDHGSFNSWGRDRFWTPDVRKTSCQVEQDPQLPFLDMTQPTVIENNRWRCDHGWDIDLDDGSSRYRIRNNLLLGGGLKLREGYDRVAENNIIINNSLHLHVWYERSGDVFVRNIVSGSYRPIGMNACIPSDGKWGKEMDYNFFAYSDSASCHRFAANGCDVHSTFGDPMFMDAREGDFRVREESPALRLGFRNFPMDSFGVVSPRLRALAKVPDIPVVSVSGMANSGNEVIVWMGVRLKNITSLGQQSAVGLKDWNGAWVEEVPASSVLARSGLRINDVVLKAGGKDIRNVADLRTLKLASRFELEVWRNQQTVILTVEKD